MRRIEVLLALDVELAVGATLKLESNDDAGVLGDDVSDHGEVGSQCLDRFDEAVRDYGSKASRSMKRSVSCREKVNAAVNARLTACSSADRSLRRSECKSPERQQESDQHELRSNLDETHPSPLLTDMIDLDIGSRDHPQPLVDRQYAVVSRVGPGSDGAEYVVEGCIRRKVPLHAVLLFGGVSSSDEAFDHATNLADWVLHLCACGVVWCRKMVEGMKGGCPRFGGL